MSVAAVCISVLVTDVFFVLFCRLEQQERERQERERQEREHQERERLERERLERERQAAAGLKTSSG